jgi:hypothetical protein
MYISGRKKNLSLRTEGYRPILKAQAFHGNFESTEPVKVQKMRVLISFVDIQITDRQNVDIQIVNKKNVDDNY